MSERSSRAGGQGRVITITSFTVERPEASLLLSNAMRPGVEGWSRSLARQEAAFAAPRPLHAMWEFNSEPDGVALIAEFYALANHRPAIREEVAAYAERFREQQAAALHVLLAERGIDTGDLPPVVIPVLMTLVARVLVMEEGLGMKNGHAETRAIVEQWLDRLESGDLLS